MSAVSVRPRCSAALEEDRCHLTVAVPQAKGMLVKSMIRRVRSNLGWYRNCHQISACSRSRRIPRIDTFRFFGTTTPRLISACFRSMVLVEQRRFHEEEGKEKEKRRRTHRRPAWWGRHSFTRTKQTQLARSQWVPSISGILPYVWSKRTPNCVAEDEHCPGNV